VAEEEPPPRLVERRVEDGPEPPGEPVEVLRVEEALVEERLGPGDPPLDLRQ
jgi:hypothetical protein